MEKFKAHTFLPMWELQAQQTWHSNHSEKESLGPPLIQVKDIYSDLPGLCVMSSVWLLEPILGEKLIPSSS